MQVPDQLHGEADRAVDYIRNEGGRLRDPQKPRKIEVDPERQVALAMRWITTYSRGRKGKSMTESLAGELLDAFDNTGASIKKKEDTFKMAQANKAFAHYRW